MPVTFSTAQSDFAAYFLAGMHGGVARGIATANYTMTQDGDGTNAQSQMIRDVKSPAGGSLKTRISARGDGRMHFSLTFSAASVEEFHAMLKQGSDGLANVATRANSQNWRDWTIPTLTAFSAPVISAAASAETAAITLALMKAQGDEASSAGTVDGFVVVAVSAGSLRIGANATDATAWAAGSNDVIDATHNAYWTVPAGAGGAVNAFTAKAQDNKGWLSATAIQAQVTRT